MYTGYPRNPLNPLSQQNSFSNFLLALRMDTLIGYIEDKKLIDTLATRNDRCL